MASGLAIQDIQVDPSSISIVSCNNSWKRSLLPASQEKSAVRLWASSFLTVASVECCNVAPNPPCNNDDKHYGGHDFDLREIELKIQKTNLHTYMTCVLTGVMACVLNNIYIIIHIYVCVCVLLFYICINTVTFI